MGPKNYRRLIQTSPAKKPVIDAQREGERQVLRAWINADEKERREGYESNRFVPPPDQVPRAIDSEWKAGDGFKVKSLIETRCVACHSKGGPQEKYPLETYDEIEKYMGCCWK